MKYPQTRGDTVTKSLIMPFKPRPVDPRAAEVLDEIEALVDAVRMAEAARKAEVPKLIAKAHGYGVSYDVIAERMGVSRQRVRQIERGE
jgi:DNA-directed RNA polymerase specialized sigma24 family protein